MPFASPKRQPDFTEKTPSPARVHPLAPYIIVRISRSSSVADTGMSHTDRPPMKGVEESHGDDACGAGLSPQRAVRDRRTADPRAGGRHGADQGAGLRHLPQRFARQGGAIPGHSVPARPRPRSGRRDRRGRRRRRRLGAGPAGRRRLERRLLRPLRPLPPRRVLRLRDRPGHRHHLRRRLRAST